MYCTLMHEKKYFYNFLKHFKLHSLTIDTKSLGSYLVSAFEHDSICSCMGNRERERAREDVK